MTLRIGSMDYSMYYVDPSIETAGDGSTPETALADLPTLENIADKTCFIIRRTAADYACQHVYGETSTVQNLVFWGMPPSSDPTYQLMPAAAQTAWGADTADYAQIKITGNQLLNLTSLNNLRCCGIRFFRADSVTTDAYFFQVNDSSNANVSFRKCKFTHAVGDLNAYADVVPTNYYSRYVYIDGINSFECVDCEIHHANADDHFSIRVRNAMFAVCCGNVSYATTGRGYVIYLCADTSYRGSIIRCNNNKFYYYGNGAQTNSSYIPGMLYTGCARRVEVKGLTLTYAGTLGTYSNTLYCDRYIVLIQNCYQYDIADISLDLGKCWYFAGTQAALCISPAETTDNNDYLNSVKNLTLQAAESDGFGSYNNYDAADNIDDDSWPLRLALPYGTQHAAVVDTVTVNNPRGKAAYFSGCNAKNINLKGTVRAYCSILSIATLSTWFPGRAVYAATGANIYIGTATVNKENESYEYDDDPLVISTPYETTGTVYVAEANSVVFGSTLSSSSDHSNAEEFIGVGSQIDAGNFRLRTSNYLCQTWNVNRTGGATACLKLEGSANSGSATFMGIGRYPYQGIEVTPTATGVHLARIYVAAKGFSSSEDLADKTQVEIEVPDADGRAKVYRSNLCGVWNDDADSVWNNDSDLTQYVLEIPVDIETTDAVQFRIFYNYYSASGFLYIDPAVTLTAIV